MRLALELLVLLFFLCPLCTTLGTCRPVTTEKLPFHTCRGQRTVRKLEKKMRKEKQCDKNHRDSHHERWNDRLLELGFEGVHQLFGFGVVERQHTCTGHRSTRVTARPALARVFQWFQSCRYDFEQTLTGASILKNKTKKVYFSNRPQ